MRVPLLARPTLLASLHSSAASTSALNTAYLEPTHLDEAPPPAVLERLARYSSVSLSTYSRPPFIISRGAACTVWDSEGREYLDFSGGIAVNALGHADEGVAQVVAEQSRVLVHNSNLWHNEWAGELALLLVEKTKELGGMGYAVGGATAPDAAPPSVDEKGYPSSGLKVFFSNSGTEANEGALKFARKWGKQTSQDKVEIVSFRDGFHGRSMGALSGTWNPKYQAPFAPLIPGFVMGCLNGIGALQHTITEKTCGVIVEPIQASPYSRNDTTITDSSA
jgi:acetylornithine aminotransferase